MAILNAFDNKPVLSNISSVSEFRIKNSSLAFSILSSGLYANKIRAIIRELSCNAVDAHIASGIPTRPFTVHLPTVLEPYFSIRDYGIALSDNEIANVFTVFFESTKNDSNNFIGALGLGCKSPLSYTTNFTVISIKNSVKNIYTVYINDQGFPAIALLDSSESDEETGVEISFSVKETCDINKFQEEAQYVYSYFDLVPEVTGVEGFKSYTRHYHKKNIIPGVNQRSDINKSFAIMGSIPYPIDIPNASSVLEELEPLLNCGLEIHFGIGSLDFQASREGLSYIPQTIEVIKNKLQEVSDGLYFVLESEAKQIDNYWNLVEFLVDRGNNKLWQNSVDRYVTDNSIDAVEHNYYNTYAKSIDIGVSDIANYNISLRKFYKNSLRKSIREVTPTISYNSVGDKLRHVSVLISTASRFIVNDTKTGGLARTKNHFRNEYFTGSTPFYLLLPVDPSKPMQLDSFWNDIKNPPKSCLMKVSELDQLPKQTRTRYDKDISILRVENNYGKFKWREYGQLDDFDDTTTYYYLPLIGLKLDSQKYHSIESFMGYFKCGVKGLPDNVYGVRRSDIKRVRERINWVNAEEYLEDKVKTISDSEIKNTILRKFNKPPLYYIDFKVKSSSPANKIKKMFDGVKSEFNYSIIRELFHSLTGDNKFDRIEMEIEAEVNGITSRYPILNHLSNYCRVGDLADAISEYIELIDATKGV